MRRLAQMECYARAARLELALADGEAALAVGAPAPGLLRPRLARDHLDAVRHHEGRIEADAELPDQARRVLALAGSRLGEEGGGTRARDGAEVVHQLLAAHADAVVRDRKRAGVFLGREQDPEIRVAVQELGPGERLITQAVAGIGGVRDQLAEEDLLLAVERMRHDIQELRDLGLEAEPFLGHGPLAWLPSSPAVI